MDGLEGPQTNHEISIRVRWLSLTVSWYPLTPLDMARNEGGCTLADRGDNKGCRYLRLPQEGYFVVGARLAPHLCARVRFPAQVRVRLTFC